jgi:hypothetical protein
MPAPTGSIIKKDSGIWYKIENAQRLAPFFINVPTASDIWMFMSSNGALTAGRQNADGALFPYETDDRLHMASSTGPVTLIRTQSGRVWEPFNTGRDNPFKIRRNLYKRLTGDAVMYEEINDSLKMTFSYKWEGSEHYGIVRSARLENRGDDEARLEVLDGVQNIMPHGVTQGLADSSSCLTDAYKACERFDDGSLAVYSLTSAIVDTPEPVEMLRANVAWRIGQASAYLLSDRQIPVFCDGGDVKSELRSAGRKGAYLTREQVILPPGASHSWMLVMDARLSQRDVARLKRELDSRTQDELRGLVEEDVRKGTRELTAIVAAADGLQLTEDKAVTARHYMNVLYNNMRGGVFVDNYDFNPELLTRFAYNRNHALASRKAEFFKHSAGNIRGLREAAFNDGDPDLIRVCLEFLPLTFSRRHGDPSRPWNRFNIRVKDDGGNRVYHYEGNWRDIFQNWEALALSFPDYIEPIIAKFLNASTMDGFNPYRLTSDGIDWEVPEPHNPFSGYGYWGDHQIVYLTKLLEWLDAYAPERLQKLAGAEIFSYADVPYEIKPYASLVADGKNTIAFNYERNDQIMSRVKQTGADGRLVTNADGTVRHVSLLEKLLVPVLAKLSNLVPGGGIWMNTQRPEWNDANNAIVGNGLSMVTVYQLYRHMLLIKKLAVKMNGAGTALSADVKQWLDAISGLLASYDKKTPRAFIDEAGLAFQRYRAAVYANALSGSGRIGWRDIIPFTDAALAALKTTVNANKRGDGLYNAYNIMRLYDGGLTVSPMFPMLEGQTAVLGSGLLTPDEAVALVEKMEAGGLYSHEHKTFYLYPVKRLKTFIERNIIPQEYVKDNALLTRLINDGHEGLIVTDAGGSVRFNEGIRQSSDLEAAISALKDNSDYAAQVNETADSIREIYEHVFAHRQFTGRSGIMYKYEGIGSIYWHQNAKLLLSFQECVSGAFKQETENIEPVDASHRDTYYRLREGFGFNKGPDVWGAFPLEPYSHSPMGMPAQQPGMTGQVKEDILTRNTELGVTVNDGLLSFKPALLNRAEFLTQPDIFNYVAVNGEERSLFLPAGSLAFTVCQVPVIYRLGDGGVNNAAVHTDDGNGVTVRMSDGSIQPLDAERSRALFARDGSIERIEVAV